VAAAAVVGAATDGKTHQTRPTFDDFADGSSLTPFWREDWTRQKGETMTAKERAKGNRIEREIVELHKKLGIHAERYPLSGSSRFRGSGHDVDVYVFGREEAPLVAEIKGRKSGAGFTMLEKWLGDYDVLYLRRNHSPPMVMLPWRTYEQLVTAERSASGVRRTSRLLWNSEADVSHPSVPSRVSPNKRHLPDDPAEKAP
jgi:hypothetical protein